MTHITNSKGLRLCRSLICLVLVCCILFNVATVPAKAAVVVDDLVLLGIMGAAILLLGGVVFNGPTQDDFRSIGQSFSNALDSAVKTDEDQIIITAVRQDLIEQARQGMNYNKPPQIDFSGFDFIVNAAIMAWIYSFLKGEKSVDNEVTSYNGVYLPQWGQYYTAGTTVTMPQHPGYTDPNTFTVNNTDYCLYRLWSGPSATAAMYNGMYFYCIIAEGDIQFDVTTSNSRTKCSQYSSDYLIDVDGTLYSWANVSISYSISKSSTAKIAEFDSYRSGCFVISDYRLGVEYSSENSAYGPLQEKILGGTIVAPSYDSTSRYPDLLTGGIKDYLDNGGSTQDIVLPDIDLSGIMQNGETLDEAVSGSMSDVANGSVTWQEYVDAVTPDGDITTQEGNEITDTGVSEDVSLWGLLKRMADYLLNGLSALKNGITSLNNFFTGTTIIQSPLDAIKFGALFDLFPFNIPYGIYQAISFWDADASPPVITIPLPTVEESAVGIYKYEINFADIPGMDPLVSVIRAGELILFAIGLLIVTRKVTKW